MLRRDVFNLKSSWTSGVKIQTYFPRRPFFVFRWYSANHKEWSPAWPFLVDENKCSLVTGHWNSQPISCRRVKTLRPRQNDCQFADDIFNWIFFNENISISIKISLKFVHRVPVNITPALVQIMAWRRPGAKPLSEPMMVSLSTHICATRHQWVKNIIIFKVVLLLIIGGCHFDSFQDIQ